MDEQHEHYYLSTFLGLDRPPVWWNKKSQVAGAVAELWNHRQAEYFENQSPEIFKSRCRTIAKSLKIKKSMLMFLLGIASTEPHTPYNAVRVYLFRADNTLSKYIK